MRAHMIALMLVASSVLSISYGVSTAHSQPAAAAPAPPALPPNAPPPATIGWQVHHGFRLFDDADEVIAKENGLFGALLSAPTLEKAYSNFAPLLIARRGEINFYEHTRYDRDGGEYFPTMLDGGSFVAPADQKIDAALVNAPAAAVLCDWYVNHTLAAQGVSCSATVPLVIPLDRQTFTGSAILEVKSQNQTLATTTAQTRDTLIVVLGDSYAAGEGNPDKAADLSWMRPAKRYNKDRQDTWWTQESSDNASFFPRALPEWAGADWWGRECHRSLFSPQVLAGLKLAALHRDQSVTLVSFACAGASVLDGLVVRQAAPPGIDHLASLRIEAGQSDDEGVEGQAADTAQLNRAVKLLCASGYAEPSYESYGARSSGFPTWRDILHDRARDDQGNPGRPPTSPQCASWKRKPDLIFLSIGGNDVGFAGLATWGLTQPDLLQFGNTFIDGFATGIATAFVGTFHSWNGLATVCPWKDYPNDPRCGVFATNSGARELIGELPRLLDMAKDIIGRSKITDRAVIIHEAYPSPLRDSFGNYCGKPSTPEFPTLASREQLWRADEGIAPFTIQLAISEDAAKVIDQTAFLSSGRNPSLLDTLRKAQIPNKWVLTAQPDFSGHGICAGRSGAATDFPYPTPSGGGWTDASKSVLANWQPYSPTQERWLRTSSDSLLTETISDYSGAVSGESLSGTFHPTAHGEAAVADEIVKVALAIHP